MFGSFPPSANLYSTARRPLGRAPARDRDAISNARASVRALAEDAAALIAASADGPEAVARVGAERIAASDRRYFGAELRRRAVIPIGVENPNRHELVDEGKGLEIWGRSVPAEAVRLARDAIYRRRLEDGDLAVERYDLSLPSDRERAIAVLEALVPRSRRPTSGGRVWLWVNGGLDARGIGGHDATAHVESFRRDLSRADVDTSRLCLLSKPHVDLPDGPGRGEAFEAAVDRFRALGLPLSVNFDSQGLARLIERPSQR
jgi:hypothetical protein